MKGYSVLGVRSWVLGGICALLFVAALAPARSPFAPGDILLHISVQGRGEIVIKLFAARRSKCPFPEPRPDRPTVHGW